ncbi:MAG: hypothetical protein J6X40_00230 [Bacteroidales bacterium]|nr:hypothetical protein [Bacteroidales bacterium]
MAFKKQESKSWIRENRLSAFIQTLTVLLLLAVIVLAFLRVQQHFWKWIAFGTALLLILLQCIRLKYPLLLIDRIFANYAWKQIALALLFFILTMDFALCIFPNYGLRRTFVDFISPRVLLEEAEDSYRYEFDTTLYPSNYDQVAIIEEPAQYKSRGYYFRHGFIYFLGVFIFNGLLIATINRFMATRADRYKKGNNTYKNIRDHYVIIGYGPSCPSIIRNLYNRGAIGPRTRLLLLTSQDPETIRLNIRSQLQELEEKTVIYSGDMDATSHLERLRIQDAREVYILGEGRETGRDSRNLACAKNVKSIREKANVTTTLPVNVQLDKPGSYSTIKRITIPKQYYKNEQDREVTYLHPFNFYENWARLLWGYHHLEGYRPLDRGRMVSYGPDNKPLPAPMHVHLVIAGFNEMGMALLLQALRICHYPNYNENTGANKTRITVVDPNMDQLLPQFQSQYPYLPQITDIEIEYRAERIEGQGMRAFLNELAVQPDTLLTVALCFNDADSSLSAALTLPESLYYQVADGQVTPNQNTEILVRQEIKSGLANVLDEENGKFANVKVFGTIDKGVDDQLLDDKMAILINAHYHFKYGCNPSQDFFQLVAKDREKTLSEAVSAWIALNEDQRFANRYQTEIYKSYQTYRPLLDHDPELLYQTEHLRWCAERSITGYRDLHALHFKSNTYQIHNLIVPYHQLNDHEKGKDKDVLHIMDQIIALSEHLPGSLL